MGESQQDLLDFQIAFGGIPGGDRFLFDHASLTRWLGTIGGAWDTVSVLTIGKSTEGRPLHVIAIASPAILSRLDHLRDQRRLLNRSETLPNLEEAQEAGQVPIVAITAGIHATEVGGVQLMPEIIRGLACDPAYAHIRTNVLTLLVPTLNPDGMDLVHAWYTQTLGTPAEGTMPPALYHRYAGHDNNRDWYQGALQETRVVLDGLLRPWTPHVVLDLHQMGERAPRYVIPPYIDPVEPHVHPLLSTRSSALGAALALAHVRENRIGVAHGIMFDAYAPSRAWPHYHGGVRMLAEAASVRIATPVDIPAEEWDMIVSDDLRLRTAHQPDPWPGGQWTLRHIMDYHRTTILGLLEEVVRQGASLITDQVSALRDQTLSEPAGYWVIPPIREQPDPGATAELIAILERGDLNVTVATAPGHHITPGSFLIDRQQPFGSWADALLSLTPYPTTPTLAYDVTTHCLPIHMGVVAEFHESAHALPGRSLTDGDRYPFVDDEPGSASEDTWLVIDGRGSRALQPVVESLRHGAQVHRLLRPHLTGRRLLPAGSWLVHETDVEKIDRMARQANVRTWRTDPISHAGPPIALPRIAVYDPQLTVASDVGWLRLTFEHLGIPFTEVTGADILHRALRQVDVLLIPNVDAQRLIHGNPSPPYPESVGNGLNERIRTRIRTWVHRGGRLIAFGGGAEAMIQVLDLPVALPLVAASARQFSSPGAVVRLIPNAKARVMAGISESFGAMLRGNTAFEVRDSGTQLSLARIARDHPVVSGTLRGKDRLAGKHAIVQVTVGEGVVTLFAFSPHFRAQMHWSLQVLGNVLFQPGTTRDQPHD